MFDRCVVKKRLSRPGELFSEIVLSGTLDFSWAGVRGWGRMARGNHPVIGLRRLEWGLVEVELGQKCDRLCISHIFLKQN
ncbi:MAG: hypothetical protein AB1589_25115 [Cyanobacteriota bacterium]